MRKYSLLILLCIVGVSSCSDGKLDEGKINEAGQELQQKVEKGADTLVSKVKKLKDTLVKDSDTTDR